MSPLNYKDRLTRQLSIYTNNQNFDDWCENIGDECFANYANTIPIQLSKYYNSLQILNVTFTNKIATNGRIKPTQKGFIIEINEKLKNEFLKNIYIAHEIAHTFFYKRVDENFTHIADISLGSDDLEYACNRIARCLIVPRKPLVKLLESFSPLDSELFSMKMINHLSQTFNISHKIFLIRVTADLNLWNDFLLIRLRRFANNGSDDWRLVEKYFNYNNSNRILSMFIAPSDKYKNWTEAKKYPKLRGKLVEFIDTVYNGLKYGEEKKIIIKVEDMLYDPLKTFMKNFENKKFTNCLVSKTKYKGGFFLNLFIKLNKQFITK